MRAVLNIVFGVLLASVLLVGVGARLGVLLLAWTEGAGHDDTTAMEAAWTR